MKNSKYQRLKCEDTIKLIKEYQDYSWEWFLESMGIRKASSGQTYYKLFMGKFNENGYLNFIKGKPKEIPAKRFKTKKITIVPKKKIKSTVGGPLSILESKTFRLIKQHKESEKIKQLLNISNNKLTRIKNKLVRKGLIKISPDLGEHSKQTKYKSYPILNLKPFFDYCEQVKDKSLVFTKPEKRILELLYNHENNYIRNQIYLEYKGVDFLEAIIKFHLKHFFLPYRKTKPIIKTRLKIDKKSIKWIIGLNDKELYFDFYELKEIYHTRHLEIFYEDLNKIKKYDEYIAQNWKEFNTTDIDQDDFNFYGGIYHAFYNFDKDLMKNLGWKLIKIFALKNT